jgi:signal transduction histidine kinase
MNYLSTKLRLIILGIVTTISIFTILGVAKIFNDKEIQLLDIKQEVMGIREHVLEIERNIHLFMLNKQSRFIKFAFEEDNKLKAHIENLSQIALKENLNINNLNRISYLQNQYRNIFHELYLVTEEIGLSKYTGLRGKMRNDIHRVEAFFLNIDNIEMLNYILSIRRSEKDFLLRKSMLYVDEHKSKMKELISKIEQTKGKDFDFTPTLHLLKRYQNYFLKIVYDFKEIGLDNSAGLQNELKNKSKLIDMQMNKTIKQLEIDIQDNIVDTIIIYFIIATTIIAIIILINILIIRSVVNEIKATQDKLVQSEKMASLGGLVAGVAHEVNTPIGIALTGISHINDMSKKISQLYRDDNLSQDEFEDYLRSSKEVADSSLKSINKASELIRSFKKVSIDQTNEDIRVFNLYEYTQELILSLNNVIKYRKISLHVDIPKNLNINSLPGSYGQIITNLIMNSFIHAYDKEDSGNIDISATKNENTITLIYKDDGKGIKKEDLNKIFDPFFTTARTTGGSGLGLHIIYNIITTTFKGSIICKSEQNKGVEFLIKLFV